jgi:hypothetical protein
MKGMKIMKREGLLARSAWPKAILHSLHVLHGEKK